MKQREGCAHVCGCADVDDRDVHSAKPRGCWYKKGHRGAHRCDDCNRQHMMREPGKIGRPRSGSAPRRQMSSSVADETKLFFASNKDVLPGQILDDYARMQRARAS